ncbi:E3 ubiquitin-protein ligase BRE1A [Mucor circinelloides]
MSGKRTLKEDNDDKKSTIPSRPPLKKRFVSGSTATSVTPVPSTSKRPELTTTLPDNPSKKELLEHMYSAKNAYIQEKQHLNQLKEGNMETNALYGTIRLQLAMLRDEFAAFPAIPLPEKCDDGSIVNQLKLMCLQITEHIQAWSAHTRELTSDTFRNADSADQNQVVLKYLQSDIEQLTACNPENKIQILQQDNDSKSSKMTSISSDIESVAEQLARSNDALEDCLQAIAAIQKRQDRLKSSAVSEVLGTAVEEDHEEKSDQQSAEEPPQRTQIDELTECQQLLTSRTQELAKRRQEKDQLHARLDDLLDRFSQLSSDYIKSNSIYVNHLQSMIELEYNLIQHYEQRRASLIKEEDGFTRERRQLIDQQNSEMSSREATLVTETKRLQETLLRVRNQRDGLQQEVQSRMMEDKQVSAYHDQIISIAEKEKSRMVELEQDILHKRQATDTVTLLPEDYLNYRKLKLQIEKTHGILHTLRHLQQQQQTENNQMDVEPYMASPLMETLTQLIHQRNQLELLTDFYQRTEPDLYAQMDYDISGIGQRIPTIQHRIDDKLSYQQKLQAEISKFGSKNAELVDKKHENDLRYAQHLQQNQLHDKSISLLDEKIASIEAKVTEKETLIKQLDSNVERNRLMFDDISQECSELQSNQQRLEAHALQLQDMAREKMKILEQETLDVQQAKNEYEKINKRWNLIQQGENPASQELVDEVEELRSYFKCSTCKTRRRECILTSCMHTFCHECIRIRLETRQRRCPSCAITFGNSDVKGIYLYGK